MCFVSKTSKKPMDWEATSVLGVGNMALCDVIVPGISMGKAITVTLVQQELASSNLDKHGAASLLHHLLRAQTIVARLGEAFEKILPSPAPQP